MGFVASALLIWDWISLLFSSGTQNGSSSQRISTRTLKLQAAVFGFLSLWIFTVLVPSTLFVRTRHAKVMDSMSNMTMLPANLSTVDTRYWDYGFRESFLNPSLLPMDANSFNSSMPWSGSLVHTYCIDPIDDRDHLCSTPPASPQREHARGEREVTGVKTEILLRPVTLLRPPTLRRPSCNFLCHD